MDIYAFRVIVTLTPVIACSGQMHSLYKAASGSREKIIAIQSERLSVFAHLDDCPARCTGWGPDRTEDMDRMAEMGVAAHWAYKEHGETNTTAQIRAQRWMQSLLELQQSAGSSFEFIEALNPISSRMIYVSHRKGRIVELPAGARPIDVVCRACADIGHAC